MKAYCIYLSMLCFIPMGLMSQNYVLVIHGGAGTIRKENFSPEQEKTYRASLDRVLLHGQAMLAAGRSSLDVVEEVVALMEDDSLYNAGKGSVLNAKGEVECDASIMSGFDLAAGAVTGSRTTKNPIRAARMVMDKSPHVILSGEGGDEFSQNHGLEQVHNSYFITARRKSSYRKNNKHGTVGAVALDIHGNLAAATSTGGMSGKSFGRIGDSPIIGAGTYANNESCAVSCTGHGEYFIRHAVAHRLSAMMEFSQSSLREAAHDVIHKRLKEDGGSGGLIAVDRSGNIAMPFNTDGMYRGYITENKKYIAIFRD